MEIGVAVVLVLAALAAAVLQPMLVRGARSAGVAARQRTIARTGKDPADNPVNNSVNRWAEGHPVAAQVAPVAFVSLVLVAVLWWDA